MKPILVVIHIYYSELWNELKKCLKNITVPYELYVTTVEKNRKLKSKILNFNKRAHFTIIKNNGFDVGPFVHILNKVNLDNYSYVIKLHTKRDMPLGAMCNYYDMSGNKWREYALNFIKTKDNFKTVLNTLENNQKIGMIDNYHLIVNKEKDDNNAAQKAILLLQKCGLKNKQYGFVAGTQFIVRANILKPLLKLNFQITDFDIPDANHRLSGLAHALERLFGCLCLNQGFEIKDVLTQKHLLDCLLLRKIYRFLYRKKINKKDILIIKICKIPVWRERI